MHITLPSQDAAKKPEAERAFRNARNWYSRGAWDAALHNAEIAVNSGVQAGWDIIGMVACQMEDLQKLNSAYRRATLPGKREIESACLGEQLVLTKEGVFVKHGGK